MNSIYLVTKCYTDCHEWQAKNIFASVDKEKAKALASRLQEKWNREDVFCDLFWKKLKHGLVFFEGVKSEEEIITQLEAEITELPEDYERRKFIKAMSYRVERITTDPMEVM